MIVEGYMVTLEQGATSWGAWVEDLPGCVAVAETRAECERLIAEAIPLHLDGLRRQEELLAAAGGADHRIERALVTGDV